MIGIEKQNKTKIRMSASLDWVDCELVVSMDAAGPLRVIDGAGNVVGHASIVMKTPEPPPVIEEKPCNGCAKKKRWLPLPGDLLKAFIFHATRGRVHHGVGCEVFRQSMNDVGWIGCIKRWRIIISRCRDQAAAEGLPSPMWFGPFYLVIAIVHWLVSRSRSR